MKLTTGIVFLGMVAGTAWGQNPNAINNTRDTLKTVQHQPAANPKAAMAPSQGGAANPALPASSPAKHSAKKTSASGQSQAGGRTQEIAAQTADRGGEPEATREGESGCAQADQSVQPAGSLCQPGGESQHDGFGCSVGKRCLAIDQINLKGVVKADSGMIAVVVNSLNKAYFLRENDPVFNGYVVKITGDSIIFKETIQDRLGKAMTREVTKKITTSAV